MRFNASSITVKDSEPGGHFNELLDLYMVYISENDFIRGEKTTYHVEKVIRETKIPGCHQKIPGIENHGRRCICCV